MTDAITTEELVREAAEKYRAWRVESGEIAAMDLRAYQRRKVAELSEALGDVIPGQMRAILDPRLIPPATIGDEAAAVVRLSESEFSLRRLERAHGNVWGWRRLDPDQRRTYPEIVVDILRAPYTMRADVFLAALADAADAPPVVELEVGG